MIKLKNVSFTYQTGVKAINDVTIDTDKGSIIGIIGANGAGKSTVMKLMLGVLRPQNGQITLAGEKITYKRKALNEHHKKVGMVFQNPDDQVLLNTVFEDVAYGCHNLHLQDGIIESRVKSALKEVDLVGFEERFVQYLSFGEKKRVAIAGILAMGHDMILMDEPTAGLDPHGRQEMIRLIKKLSEEGKKILISSHDMDLIHEVCNHLYLLSRGSVTCEGSPEHVFDHTHLIEEAKLELPWLMLIKRVMGKHSFKNKAEFLQVGGNDEHSGHWIKSSDSTC
ncbi:MULTISPECIES: energy-coupling factor ABC transporter ATP-binding protein [unclassified Fusibacter]|uniref:energy-coupling factor ABC transporter ATP-binding protein n=1 Tax=unclassified Fusibacter TaxID=2624464 RepID=UPI0010117EEC|nr:MULTISPECIES: ABC transporter ATP-binding protein [unclassified Fusibacter]MCK8060517.1 energy-coupling factor ABC transporter ATP-binding protein [Fusibacter sp. A2]NPE20194.1 ABC transporter ATP-binding protein [Fusibacter sp. A1]RXV63404.1 ABC transporter ATP-binding protein [Fusibacter sp. A1]